MSVAREPKDAARRFLTALGRVTECVTTQRLYVLPGGYAEPGVTYLLAFGPKGEPVPLSAKSGGQSGFLFDIHHRYAIVEDERAKAQPAWRVTTSGYEYRILDSRENEILTYHWDPSARRGPKYPHLHATAEATVYFDALTSRRIRLDGHHMPTGRVLVEWVVRLLIADFGVAYRYRNWATRLAASEAFFREEATQQP